MIDATTVNNTAKSDVPKQQSPRRHVMVGFALGALLLLAGCSSSVKLGPEAVAGLAPDGTVDMEQVQAAFIGSAGGGSGTLFFRGGSYPFAIGGLGVGGIGASTINAEGEVYKLNSLAELPWHLRPGPLRLRNRHYERRRSLAAE